MLVTVGVGIDVGIAGLYRAITTGASRANDRRGSCRSNWLFSLPLSANDSAKDAAESSCLGHSSLNWALVEISLKFHDG